MPWNQPGGDNNKDPWGGGNKNRQGPPDIDEILKKITGKLSGIGGGGGGGAGKAGSAGLLGLLVLGLIIWVASGFYIVNEGERALVLRFGEFNSVTEPGPNWHLPTPIEKVELVDVDQVQSFQMRSTMLTQDENIVDIELAAQYRIKNAEDYIFQVRSPVETLHRAVQSALREAVGKQKMDFVLNEGRPQIASVTKELTQNMLDTYRSGMLITTVNLQQSQPPEQVQDAFNDAIKAREDNVRFVNEAETYSNGIIPQARGEAARVTEQAAAYQEQVVAESQGDASRFSQLRKEYEKAPEVTRKRMYLETVETVFSNTSKVIVDSKGGNSMMYLPLDKLISSGQASSANSPAFQSGGLDGVNSGNGQARTRSSGRPARSGRESR
ncbi:MAG TPA: FtsH protease activity modulator HflK [Gammaproteobacteria bacterium]|nr:FtsH protease activity modulator HflK [Gammaproteobacteria bacterium]